MDGFCSIRIKGNLIVELDDKLMAIELDHLFICSQVNAPEMEHLLDFGLVEGRSNIHPGQGTANRCIFFDNFMLELLFVREEKEISSPIIAPTNLRERCHYHQTGYSPFGIAFRCIEQDANLPFQTWTYKPPYLPPQLQIDIVRDTKPHEPLIFVIPFEKRKHTRPIDHPVGIRRVTGMQIEIPSNKTFSESVKTIDSRDIVNFQAGTANLVIIECDRGKQKKARDFRPYLPLIFRF